jgi:hypothetical protein
VPSTPGHLGEGKVHQLSPKWHHDHFFFLTAKKISIQMIVFHFWYKRGLWKVKEFQWLPEL